jgi:uncharacterized protein YeaO (DUF488 family)
LIRVKRIYEPAAAEDGFRVLVDRVWPRGVKKTAAAVDLWLKDVAPSTELRKWFAHDPAKCAGATGRNCNIRATPSRCSTVGREKAP